MNTTLRAALKISRTGSILGGILLLLAAIVIGIDIILRTTISRSIGGADELSGLALAIASAWGLSNALLTRAHIRVDTLYLQLAKPWRIVLDLVAYVGLMTFTVLIAWYALFVLMQSWTSQARSMALSIPLMVPQGLWFGGLAFLIAVECLLLVQALLALSRRDTRAFFSTIGVKTVEEEIEEETAEQSVRLSQHRMEQPR